MPAHQITRAIEFCYGHRLVDHGGRCRHLHGHNGVVEVDVAADSLDEAGMVVDFGRVTHLVKGWIDANIDHRMILERQDPVVKALTEMGELLYLLDENPTAENLSKHIFEKARGLGLNVVEVRLWETPSSYATYREP